MSDRSLRILQGCPHSRPIVIPCEICVETRITSIAGEALLRGANEMKEQNQETISKLQKSVNEAFHLKGANEKLVNDNRQLSNRIAIDAAEIKRLRTQVQDMAARQYAEQASRLIPVENLRREDDEAV